VDEDGLLTGQSIGTAEVVASYESLRDTTFVTVVAPPMLGTAFGAPTVPSGGTTPLTFTLANPNPNHGLTGVGFTDTLPGGLVVATPNGFAGTCTGVITAMAGSGSVSLSNGTLGEASSCIFTVNVTATGSGRQTNATSAVASTEGGAGSAASDSLVVTALPAANIPTLSEWMLLLLGLMLSVAAMAARSRRHRR
jgi:hypothetical protein